MGFMQWVKKGGKDDKVNPVDVFRVKGIRALDGLSENEKKAAFDWAMDVGGSFGKVLERRNRTFESLRTLPHTADDIMLACSICILFWYMHKEEKRAESVKIALISLGNFVDISEDDADGLTINNAGSFDPTKPLRDVAAIDRDNAIQGRAYAESKKKTEEIQNYLKWFMTA